MDVDDVDEGDSAADEKRFPTRAWFIPLEDPLNLPQGYIVEFPRQRSVLDPVWSDEGSSPYFRQCEAMISLKIWQLESGLAPLQERTGLAFDACRQAFPTYFETDCSASNGVEWPDLKVPATVVEATVSIYRDGATNEMYGSILNEVVDEIRRLQRACSYVSGAPVRPMSLEALPPYIPTATGSVGESGFRTDGDVGVYLLPQNVIKLPSRRDFDAVEMQSFQSFLYRSDGAFSGYLASQNEARAALLHRGDARSSLLASATACEVFLDEFLKHLLWERLATPESCVPMFVEGKALSTVLSRTRKELGPIVGGNWNDATQQDLRDWQSGVAHVRHRTIHGGYVPTLDEARAAVEASDRLRDHAVNVLANNLKMFPRTALMLIGSQALEARGKLTKAVRREIDSGQAEDWGERFVRWRRCLARLVEREIEPFDPDQNEAYLIGVITGRRKIKYVRHHRESGLAAAAELLSWSPTIERIEKLAEAIPDGKEPLSVAIEDGVPTRLTEQWVAEHRRLPLCGVMANCADSY
ncbi:hypothetical protein BVU76_27005 [Mycolicibacterium porcinum]|nr:hypothetical protein BVU76_27005 [Mycolicibacterium porcinum]